jgi:tetratricopeptide (TPR) repeat protein
MRSIILLFFVVHSFAAIAQSELQKGIGWFEQRTEGAMGIRAKREPIDRAIAHLRNAMAEPQHELQAALYLCRSYIFKGRFVETESKLKSRSLEEAKITAEKMLKKYPNNRELRFEHLAGLGLWGESIGIFRAAKEGIATRMKEACEIMIRIDPEFMNGVGKRSLGVLNYKVPAIPFIISWPDKKLSLALLAEVMKSYPDDMASNFYYAEALVVSGKKAEAEQYLKRVLAFAPSNEHLLEQRMFHIEAKKLLLEIKGK